MTSFEIECPPSFHGCDRIDVFAVHQANFSDFHLVKDGSLVTVIQRHLNGKWEYKSGKPIADAELDFIRKQIEDC